MSDISNSNSSSSSKRRLNHVDDTIEYLTQELNTWNDFMHKSEFECSLMTVKMKREKVKALSAAAKSQVILANMEVLIAESDLVADLERLRNFKRRKLHYEGESQVTPPLTTTTVPVQTTESKSNKKKKTRRGSSKKTLDDISSDETVIIPSIHESSKSLVETSQKSQTSFSLGLFTKSPANKSDSEVSLSSSIKEEFNEPYTKTLTQDRVKKSPAKKQKSEKKMDSKTKSKYVSQPTQSPTGTPKTVADLRKSVNTASNHINTSSHAVSTPKTEVKNSTACATYLPVRHNMGVIVTQPSTSTRSPFLYVNPATQIQYQPQKAPNNQAFNFYGSKQ